MSTFVTQRSIARNIVLSTNSQTAIGETMVDGDLTYRGRPETSAFLQWRGTYESDINYAGKNGKSTPTEDRLIAQQSSGDLGARLDDFLAGWLLAFCMGQEVYTAGPPHSHAFTYKDTGDPAPLTTIYVEDTSGIKNKWADIAVSQVVLSGTDKGSITAKATLLGLGTMVAGAMGALPALPVAQYLYGSDATVSIGPVGAPVSLSPRVASWEATFDHQMEIHRGCGGGTKGSFIRLGAVMNKLKLVVYADGSADIPTWVANQTPLEITINAASGASSLLLDYVNVRLPQDTIGENDKKVAHTIELDETNILQPIGGGDAVTATVVNGSTAYLVAG